MPGPVDLTEREWDLFQALREGMTRQDIADRWNTSKTNVDNLIRRLIVKGLVRRAGDVPRWARPSKGFPWVLEKHLDVRFKPLLPPAATINAEYPPETWGKLVVDPILVVRWPQGGWCVQGLSPVPRDGQPSWAVTPEYRIVWATHDESEVDVLFRASRNRPWQESGTSFHFEVRAGFQLGTDERRDLTLCVAAVIGPRVPAVMDLTEARKQARRKPRKKTGP